MNKKILKITGIGILIILIFLVITPAISQHNTAQAMCIRKPNIVWMIKLHMIQDENGDVIWAIIDGFLYHLWNVWVGYDNGMEAKIDMWIRDPVVQV
jgi:hypothetical protein